LQRVGQTIYVSATPASFEISQAGGVVVEQILRPTGLLDPVIDVRPASTQVDDCLEEIRKEKEKGGKVLVTTLTKHLAEELTGYLTDLGVRAKYLHSDIDVPERLRIVHELRTDGFDVLVGINLLREGLDIPEVSLVTILDADKEGFLRSETSLIQICGRAARNVRGRVVMYADTMTSSIRNTIAVTTARREKQTEYNAQHNITPTTIVRKAELLSLAFEEKVEVPEDSKALRRSIKEWESIMKKAAREYRFEEAAQARDEIQRLKNPT
jgi:excinuclease ABC subunit B